MPDIDLDALERRCADGFPLRRDAALALIERARKAEEALAELIEVADQNPASALYPGPCEPAGGADLCGHENCEQIGCVIDKIARARAHLEQSK